jgi:hypothetical protein
VTTGEPADRPKVSLEQRRYALWLDRFSRIGFALLVAAFGAHLVGLLPSHVASERLPELLALPLDRYLEATGTPVGWGWLALATHGEFASLFGIAFLAGCSIACLASIVPLYGRRSDRIYVAICLLEVATLLAAATGLVTGGH